MFGIFGDVTNDVFELEEDFVPSRTLIKHLLYIIRNNIFLEHIEVEMLRAPSPMEYIHKNMAVHSSRFRDEYLPTQSQIVRTPNFLH